MESGKTNPSNHHLSLSFKLSGRSWSSGPQSCCSQLQAPPVFLCQAGGVEHSGWLWAPRERHALENRAHRLPSGRPLPYHGSHRVQGAGAAARELAETRHPQPEASVSHRSPLRQLHRAGGVSEGEARNSHTCTQCKRSHNHYYHCAFELPRE